MMAREPEEDASVPLATDNGFEFSAAVAERLFWDHFTVVPERQERRWRMRTPQELREAVTVAERLPDGIIFRYQGRDFRARFRDWIPKPERRHLSYAGTIVVDGIPNEAAWGESDAKTMIVNFVEAERKRASDR